MTNSLKNLITDLYYKYFDRWSSSLLICVGTLFRFTWIVILLGSFGASFVLEKHGL